VETFKETCAKLFFQALLDAIRNALHTLRRRFATNQIGFLFVESPVFKVDVELDIPQVVLSPSLSQVQQAVNIVAIKCIQSVKKVYCWGQDRTPSDEPMETRLQSYFHPVASNKEIVKVFHQLLCCIEVE